jgi:hypothetical protein
MHMICNSTDAERLHFILLRDPTHEGPKSLLDFAHQQRLAIFRAKNKVNIKRREVSAMAKPNFDRPSGTRSISKHQYRR